MTVVESPEGPDGADMPHSGDPDPRGSRLGAGPGRVRDYLVAGGLYLVASVVLWWHVWTADPSSVMTCGCTDAGRVVWYVEWSAYALAHGHNLLFSTWMFHPSGLNLLADTSVPAIALVMAPVTLLFGPVVSVNVAGTLIPVLTGLSMFWLLRRWVRWTPAAFVGGACYGFSAFVVVQLSFGWLNLACVALLPLAAGCLDELLIRQRVRPVRVGFALGVLVAVEFFVSSELVLIAFVSGVVAMVLLVGYAAIRDADDLRRRLPHAVRGLGTAVVVAAALLAYPIWFFLAGPAHLGGMVWSTNVPGDLGNAVSNFWSHLAMWGPVDGKVLAKEAPILGGYRGPAAPSPSFLGTGMLVVLVAGTVAWRRDRRLWFFGALGVVTAALSLRVGGGRWGPWGLVYHLPLFRNVVQSRFSAVVGLCAAVMLAVVVDRSRSATAAWLASRPSDPPDRPDSSDSPDPLSRGKPGHSGLASLAGLMVAVIALGPAGAALAPNIPLTMQAVSVPKWFLDTAPHLASGQVLLTYPFPTADSQASIPWQAIDRMHYLMAGGGGPTGTIARAGAEKAGFAVLRSASVPLLPAPALTGANLASVRDAMRSWGVTQVVVPDDAGLPRYQTARGTAFGVAFFSAVLGSAPFHQGGAWRWVNVERSPAPVAVTAPALQACLPDAAPDASIVAGVSRCVLRASSPRSGAFG